MTTLYSWRRTLCGKASRFIFVAMLSFRYAISERTSQSECEQSTERSVRPTLKGKQILQRGLRDLSLGHRSYLGQQAGLDL